jgi:hypothetical protein
MVSRRDIHQMSFGFRCDRDEWTDEDLEDDGRSRGHSGKTQVRNVKEAALYEVSLVAEPAYLDTDVNVDEDTMAMAMAGSRSLFPGGVPLEIRNRFPKYLPPIEEDGHEVELVRKAMIYLASLPLSTI